MKVLLLFLLCLNLEVFAAKLKLHDSGDPIIKLSDSAADDFGSGPTKLFVENGSAGSSATKAVKVYIPLSSTNSSNEEYFAGSVLPSITSSISGTGIINIPLDIEREGKDQFLVLAVKKASDNEYKVIKDADIFSDVSNYQLNFSFTDFCSVRNDICEDYIETSPDVLPNKYEELSVIVGIDTTNYGVGDEILESEIDKKIFFNLYFSNAINSSNVVVLESLDKGDEQLFINYAGATLKDIRSVFAFTVEDSTVNCTLPDDLDAFTFKTVKDAHPTGIQVELGKTDLSGEVKLKGLSNDKCVALRVYFKDRYGFATKLSNRSSAFPEKIQSILEKQACFFFTAGFGGEHYIVHFFQNFRDKVLQSFALGRSFVQFYYNFAPRYTHYILNNERLSQLVRAVAYCLYGFLKFWYISFSLMILGFVQFYRLR